MRKASAHSVALLRHLLFRPSEVFIAEQARSLKRYEPLLLGRELAGAPSHSLPYSIPASATRTQKLKYILTRDPGILLAALQGQRPSLVHAHFGVEGVYGMKVAERLGVPLITTFHGYDATMTRLRLVTSRKASFLVYAAHRSELAQKGACFLCVSKFIKERILEMGFPEDLARLHYIGVDTDAFKRAAESPERPMILHIARLVEKKGTIYLLEAFALIASRFPSAKLVVVGDGPLLPSLQESAAKLGVSERVEWLGARAHEQVKTLMQQASLFCLPSCTAANGDAEGLGIVLLEAAACGVPTVSTLHGGIPEAVVDGSTGYCVPERDSRALADALDSLLSSYELRRRMGENGRRFVKENFDLSSQTEKLEQLYDSVL